MYRKLLAAAAATGLALTGLAAAVPAHAGDSVPPLGTTAHMDNFDVTVHSFENIDNADMAHVTVCAKNVAPGETVRVSWDAWSVRDAEGAEYEAGIVNGGSTKADYPYGNAEAPSADEGHSDERQLADGECATGRIAFKPAQDIDPTTVQYESSLGDFAEWRLWH